MPPSIFTLNDDCLREILLFLPALHIELGVYKTSNWMREVAASEHLWELLFLRDFPQFAQLPRVSDDDYELYVMNNVARPVNDDGTIEFPSCTTTSGRGALALGLDEAMLSELFFLGDTRGHLATTARVLHTKCRVGAQNEFRQTLVRHGLPLSEPGPFMDETYEHLEPQPNNEQHTSGDVILPKCILWKKLYGYTDYLTSRNETAKQVEKVAQQPLSFRNLATVANSTNIVDRIIELLTEEQRSLHRQFGDYFHHLTNVYPSQVPRLPPTFAQYLSRLDRSVSNHAYFANGLKKFSLSCLLGAWLTCSGVGGGIAYGLMWVFGGSQASVREKQLQNVAWLYNATNGWYPVSPDCADPTSAWFARTNAMGFVGTLAENIMDRASSQAAGFLELEKDFLVFWSDRFPVEWGQILALMTGNDQRILLTVCSCLAGSGVCRFLTRRQQRWKTAAPTAYHVLSIVERGFFSALSSLLVISFGPSISKVFTPLSLALWDYLPEYILYGTIILVPSMSLLFSLSETYSAISYAPIGSPRRTVLGAVTLWLSNLSHEIKEAFPPGKLFWRCYSMAISVRLCSFLVGNYCLVSHTNAPWAATFSNTFLLGVRDTVASTAALRVACEYASSFLTTPLLSPLVASALASLPTMHLTDTHRPHGPLPTIRIQLHNAAYSAAKWVFTTLGGKPLEVALMPSKVHQQWRGEEWAAIGMLGTCFTLAALRVGCSVLSGKLRTSKATKTRSMWQKVSAQWTTHVRKAAAKLAELKSQQKRPNTQPGSDSAQASPNVADSSTYLSKSERKKRNKTQRKKQRQEAQNNRHAAQNAFGDYVQFLRDRAYDYYDAQHHSTLMITPLLCEFLSEFSLHAVCAMALITTRNPWNAMAAHGALSLLVECEHIVLLVRSLLPSTRVLWV